MYQQMIILAAAAAAIAKATTAATTTELLKYQRRIQMFMSDYFIIVFIRCSRNLKIDARI